MDGHYFEGNQERKFSFIFMFVLIYSHCFCLFFLTQGVTFLMMGSADELPDEPKDKVTFLEDMTDNELATVLDQPRGLYNLGNTCYMNATLQCLYTVPELRDALKKVSGSLDLNESFDASHNMLIAIRDLYDKMDKDSALMPVLVLEMLHLMFPRFSEKNEQGHFIQQDANECWSEILKVMQQKLTITTNGTSKNFINKFFGGNFISTMKLAETGESSTSTEDFLQLSCFISQDVKYLQTGLKLRLEEEIDKFSQALGRDAHFIKTSRISRLPGYLSVNVIRFFYKEKNSINAKILKDVKFSMTLDVYELCTPELQAKLLPMRQKAKEVEDKKVETAAVAKIDAKEKKEDEKPKEYYDYWFEDDIGSNNSGLYQLNAVLTHKGRSSSSGHYVGWVRKNGE